MNEPEQDPQRRAPVARSVGHDAHPRADANAPPRFRLPLYEGPLDLLLHLIKRAELEPSEVAISLITEQYLAHLELMETLNLDVAGEYLVMAATLMLIKSFSLLPETATEEIEEGEELKRDLVARLLEFQRYREAAEKLVARALLGRDVFAAAGEPVPATDGEPPGWRVSVFDLVEAMAAVLKRLADGRPRAVELRDIPVASCIPTILDALAGAGRIEFAALFIDLGDTAIVIATFIALLELIRQGKVRARQDRPFGVIVLELAQSV